MATSSSTSPFDEGNSLAQHVNMMELADALKVSRQTVFAWTRKWPDFPVAERGTTGRAYRFDVGEVVEFLQAKRQAQVNGAAVRDREVAQLLLPLLPEADDDVKPGASIRERIEAVKLRKLLREEAEKSGRLVSADLVREWLGDFVAAVGRHLDVMVRQVTQDGLLTEQSQRALEARARELRVRVVQEMQRRHQAPEPASEQEGEDAA